MVRVHRGSPWPVGQAVKTPPFHGGIKGSIPLRVTNHGRLAQPGERLPYKQDVGGSIPSSPTNCEVGGGNLEVRTFEFLQPVLDRGPVV